MKNLFLILVLVGVFFSCDSDVEEPEIIEKKPFEVLETIFSDGKFQDSVKISLLEELHMCNSQISLNDTSNVYAPCAPSHFKFFSFNAKKALKNSFMVQVKALSVLPGSRGVPLPVRHLFIFERENGQLVKVNGFRGNLIGWRDGKSDEKDLMIRFYLPEDQTFVNCVFTWNGGKYEFSSADSFDWGEGDSNIKTEDRDSVSNLIYTDLVNYSLLF